MGSTYTNVLLPEPNIDAVAAVLAPLKRRGYVAGDGAITVVYDERAEHGSLKELEILSTLLSSKLHRPALAVANNHEEVFEYLLADGTRIIDRYNSYPGYLKKGGETPTGGDARQLCAAFGAAAQEAAVATLLRRTCFDIGPEIVRHEQLLQLLGIHGNLPYLGYEYVSNGELFQIVSHAEYRIVGGAPAF